MIITIDGPSGSGKTTLAKELTLYLNENTDKKFEVLDTGAMFRALTLYLNENFKYMDLLPKNIDYEENLNKKIELKKVLEGFKFDILKISDEDKKYILCGKDITKDIRDMSKLKYISEVSATKILREFLLKLQRDEVKGKNIVVEGRDTGSVVFKDADFKYYLDAPLKVRAIRRYKEENEILDNLSYFDVKDNDKYIKVYNSLKKRDKIDSLREVAPLVIPKNAEVINNENLDIDETTEYIWNKIKFVFRNEANKKSN